MDVISEANLSSRPLSLEENLRLAEELNEELRLTLLPVTAIVGLETVLGFCGNLLILYVFVFHYHRCNFKYFVLCLSFVDITSTLTTMPAELVTHTYWYIYPSPLLCKIKSCFNMFTVCGSMYGLFVISIDRFRKICLPFGWQIEPRVAVILCIVQLLISFVMIIPVMFFWGTHSKVTVYKGYNVTITVCEIDEQFKSTSIPLRYTIVVETINSLIMFAMVVIYILVARKLFMVKSSSKNTYPPHGNTITGSEASSSLMSGEYIANAKDLTKCHKLVSDSEQIAADKQIKQNNARQRQNVQQINSLKNSSPTSAVSRSGMIFATAQSEDSVITLPITMTEGIENTLPITWAWAKRSNMPNMRSEESETTLSITSADERGTTLSNRRALPITQAGESGKFSEKKQAKGKGNILPITQVEDGRITRRHEYNRIEKKIKRKTLIMFILTALFIFTTVLYMSLLNLIAHGVLETLSNTGKAAYFFFFRFYFINHVINPILYGFLDPHFRNALKQIFM